MACGGKYMENILNVENVWGGEVECDLVEGPSCGIPEK